MAGDDLEGMARASIEAFNGADWQWLRDHCRDGYVYEETGTGRRFEGVEETIKALEDWKLAAPDASGEITRCVVSDQTAVLEIVWRGHQSGALETGAGTLPPSGRPFEFWASMWQRYEQGGLAEERHHLDVLTMMTQLGAVPPPSG